VPLSLIWSVGPLTPGIPASEGVGEGAIQPTSRGIPLPLMLAIFLYPYGSYPDIGCGSSLSSVCRIGISVNFLCNIDYLICRFNID
jgi:hypothetical protein